MFLLNIFEACGYLLLRFCKIEKECTVYVKSPSDVQSVNKKFPKIFSINRKFLKNLSGEEIALKSIKMNFFGIFVFVLSIGCFSAQDGLPPPAPVDPGIKTNDVAVQDPALANNIDVADVLNMTLTAGGNETSSGLEVEENIVAEDAGQSENSAPGAPEEENAPGAIVAAEQSASTDRNSACIPTFSSLVFFMTGIVIYLAH